jgi:putative FmdB family regulatory protein
MKYFDFVCNDCKASFEKLVNSKEKVECLICGSVNTVAVPGVAGFQFRGVGLEHRKK